MIRTLHLGREGEDTAQFLVNVCELGRDFDPRMLVSPYEAALAEMRRRLAEAADRLVEFEADATLAERLRTFVDEESGTGERLVVWLQQKHFDPDTWAYNLGFLQGRRDTYARKAPWMWVLAGPRELIVLANQHANHLITGMPLSGLDEEPRPLPATGAPIRWLHLSDFHFAATQRWDRRKTLTALLKHAEKLRADGLAPDLVFVTGDVGHSGKQKEYEQAERFFTELAKVLELEPRDRFFLVPGNHDVDRRTIGSVERYITAGLKTQDAVADLFDDAEAMHLVGRRLEGFYAFTERFLGPARGWRRQRPWRVDVREVHGVPVGILQLNSAWASGVDDESGLLVGEAQLQSAVEESADAFLRIVLVHHPLDVLADFDRAPVESLAAAGDVHFLLRGHLHRTRATRLTGPGGTLVELAAGATLTGERWPQRYLLTEVELTAGEARVHLFRYSDEGKGFWATDTLAYENVPDGVWTVPIDDALRLDAEAPPPAASELTGARTATLTARYRTAASAVHGSVRFVGFADHRPRPNVGVPELFVPLRLEKDREEKEDDWTTTELLQHLLREKDSPGRVVVLGDPGSGKTTLCRFSTVALAGEASLEGLDVAEGVLPLFLPFREYVRECRENDELSLIDFLKKSADVQLQLPLPKTFLEKALGEGRAVVLLDGLDEVGSAAEREKMRERVQAFCRLYPLVPALVTSRVAGYDDAPLPRSGADAFVHLTLAPFSDGDLRQFVSHWYAVQEPTDPLARDRGIADLMAALEAEAHVRELARNPMLATLIALVHRYETQLPGERAALYDICVKTLLETWPGARRTTFREIDAGLQRAYLEALAYRMQRSRSGDDRDVTVERGALVDSLVEIVRQREGSSSEPETTRGLVERWAQYLEKGSGLLVEQRPGVFGFFHLSLMEYLAARGMDEAEVGEDAVAEHFNDPGWREVCLLAVGSKATEKAFLDRLFDKVCEVAGGWSFLLRCLREEASFDEEQRAAIVLGAGRDMLRWSVRRADDKRTLDEILRFSIRHGKWAAAWLLEQLGTARGKDLRGLVALRSEGSDLVGVFEKRDDAADAATDLLMYWPGTLVGKWASETVSRSEAFPWLYQSRRELLVLRSLAIEYDIAHLTAGLLAGLLRMVAAYEILAKESATTLAARERPGGRGLPAGIRIEPLATLGFVLPVDITSLVRVSKRDVAEVFRPKIDRCDLRGFLHTFSHDFAQTFERGIARDFAETFAKALSGHYIAHGSGWLSFDFDDRLPNEFEKCFSSDHLVDILRDVDQTLLMTFVPVRQLGRPDAPLASEDLKAWGGVRKAENRKILKRSISPATVRFSCEMWIAGVTTVERSQEERDAYINRRVQNAWLLHVWPAVDRRFAEASSPDLEALYLILGFTQATTTWQWPWSDRWKELLGGSPPVHWLPRSQWHLCWLLYDPDDGVHRRGLDEALVEGLADAERPGVAEALRELLPAKGVVDPVE